MLILNHVEATIALPQQPSQGDLYPSLLLVTDNVASEAWIIKGANKSLPGKALGHIQSYLMIFNLVDINANQVSTNNNIIADYISQFPTHAP